MRPSSALLGSVREQIEKKLRSALEPSVLEVIDDSHRHDGHFGKPRRGETHFRVVVVSSHFEGLPLRERHRRIYQILQQELDDAVHALQLETRTPAEATTVLPSK
ncbi:hypothetical protein F1559_002608 [Cyanidiococcus yangmingshanensis]|uniref:BolA-like protein 1 n=1 Tax=Cyanidiococcus yangmingshanensis TaxID=2690220 RepID=A0A7J7IG64_9RHOD|nr:hypothetical protein F1559_002608 [Cyanidiococcus yangmingshanensis]